MIVFEVGSVFRIIDESTPVVDRIARQVEALDTIVNKVRENLTALGIAGREALAPLVGGIASVPLVGGAARGGVYARGARGHGGGGGGFHGSVSMPAPIGHIRASTGVGPGTMGAAAGAVGVFETLKQSMEPAPSQHWLEILTQSPALAPAVEPGFCVLVNGDASSVLDTQRADQLRCSGNGVVALQAATAFAILFNRIEAT